MQTSCKFYNLRNNVVSREFLKAMKKFVTIWTAFLVTLFLAGVANAAEVLEIPLNSSIHKSMPSDISKVAIGSSNIAKIVQVPDSMREFLIIAQGVGSTNLFVWTVDNARYEYVVTVSPEETAQARLIEKAIGLPDVHVKKIENRILLTGTVENQHERNYALQVAHLYIGGTAEVSLSVGTGYDINMSPAASTSGSGGTSIQIGGEKAESQSQIIDLLKMRNPTQIRLEAQVIAINPRDRENIGILYGNEDMPSAAPGIFALGESYDYYGATPFRNNPINWATDRHAAINLSLHALVTKNKAKILSRPSIMTMSGESAMIRVGGQIPYSAIDSNGRVNVSFKDYGIILQLKPIVDGDNKITSSVYAEVSNMSGETVDGQPILNTRSAAAVVTMHSGSTMVIGGLLDSTEQKVVNKIPLLGDIPILGEFFKYTSKSKEKQELIILVTPYLVEEKTASRTRMSDEMEEIYKKGRLEKESMNEVDVNEKFVD